MAVEATHLNVFPYRIHSNRDMILSGFEVTNNIYGGAGMWYGSEMTDLAAAKSFPVKVENGPTYAHLPNVSRKRSREENDINFNQLLPLATVPNPNNHHCSAASAASFAFLGQDFSSHMQREKLEVDHFVTHHMERVRLEVEERGKRFSRREISAIGETMMKKLKAKDEEIQKIWKVNFVLEEQLKSLCIENQIWRDLAQTNEATANTLRTNLEQVLALVQDDEQSCCGSNYEGEVEKVVDDTRICKSCGEEEASVLLLPCRHLCLCAVCGSEVHICPICNCIKNCSLHVNMTS